MNNEKEQIKGWGTMAIVSSLSVGIPSVMLLLGMPIGIEKPSCNARLRKVGISYLWYN